MLVAAHKGYFYQDILGAYFIAQELAYGRGATKLHFDHKKTLKGIPDKFDDLKIYRDNVNIFLQIKHSDGENRHRLTKQDFSSPANYDLALFDLFATWKALHTPESLWRVCLAWDEPLLDDPIQSVLVQSPDLKGLLSGTTCYQFNCDLLWPEHGEVLSSWRALRREAKPFDRAEFKTFLDHLVIEINCPQSTLLKNYSGQLEKMLVRMIEKIGIGVYPNDHLSAQQVAERLCTITRQRRSSANLSPISCDEIAQDIKIKQEYGGIEQTFPVDENVLVATPNRIDQVITALNKNKVVILTAEPGAGKSWFIENLQSHLEETTQIVKHYCYTALEDPLTLKRITINVLYGSLISQIVKSDEKLGTGLPKRYASNLEQLNLLLEKIKKKTLLIIDGIDHIWRVYQKNRGGLTEDETKIIQALSLLDISNPNVSLLIVSQPIDQLSILDDFYQCTLAPLQEDFVQDFLEKHTLPNDEVGGVSLAQAIHQKSNGNALYCKYLIDHAVINGGQTSFEWITTLPSYDFNLSGYYLYLYQQIQGDTSVPHAFCGVDFSLTETELQEITHLGNLVSGQLTPLKPILRYIPALGYSIYHESFKRFVIDSLNEQGASITDLVYRPVIAWLKTHSFFKSVKAYGHLLKLYYEVDAYHEIAQTISVEFVDDSLYYAQPFRYIKQNHDLQKAALQHVDKFVPMVIVSEQSKVIYELEHNVTDQILIKYLKAVQKIHGDEEMYRVLWDGEKLLVDSKDALRFLVQQTYQGKEVVHWSIIPKFSNIPYEILGLATIKLLHTEQYQKFDDLTKKVYENPEHKKAFSIILDEVEWFTLYVGDEWIEKTPYFRNIFTSTHSSASSLEQVIQQIISDDKFIYDDSWDVVFRDILKLVKTANDEEIERATHALSEYNWFRNWLIYLIEITALSQKEYDDKDIINAFSYLVRDLEPFKGKPRASDLYKQLPFVKKTFYWGLLLCGENQGLLVQCCELLEKVTSLTTSLQGSVSGPLTDEEYLELIDFYLPGDYVLQKYEKKYAPLKTRRLYAYVAEVAFEYTCVLSKAGQDEEAKSRYLEGVQALTAYGFRKDRTLSEVLDCSVPYHQTYQSLDIEWFFDLYRMAMTVITHTDGRSTSRYPIEWFKEFIQVYPDEALKFLASETLENSEASWHQEDEFYYLLEKYASFFSPTQWFLLCRSLPLVSSNEILKYGFKVFDQIDDRIKDAYLRWLQSRPFILNPDVTNTYSEETKSQFEEKFGVLLAPTEKANDEERASETEMSLSQPVSLDWPKNDILAFLETNNLQQAHVHDFQEYVISIAELEEKKTILRQAARSFRYGSSRGVGDWAKDIFESGSFEWLYFNVCLFVFLHDGWFHGLHEADYLKRAYQVNSSEAIAHLKEVLGHYLSNDNYPTLVSRNLISALVKLRFEETVVKELIQTIFKIVKRRLPHPPNSEINEAIYGGLDGFSRDEMAVALLIARLKTLTTEKTQGIIWSLSFLAQTVPETLFRPYLWAFLHQKFLLPVHRAVLLQILTEYVDRNLVPDALIGQFLKNYPTGFFLEDQYIRSLVNYRVELDETSANFIQHPAHPADETFFSSGNLKYRTLVEHLGTLTGTYKAFIYKRHKVSKEHSSYYIRTDEVLTPIVSVANASYEIVNGQYYDELKHLTYSYGPSYIANLRFFLEEINLQVGALSQRPSSLPLPEEFSSSKTYDVSSPIKHDGWVILSSNEEEIYGEQFKKKNSRIASLLITKKEVARDEGFYARYVFISELYTEEGISGAPFDQPICKLSIYDTLENLSIIYVSPFIVRELGLKISPTFHNGLHAYNKDGELIIKNIVWKEDYYGSISDSTEVPRLTGAAVLIRSDYYEKMLSLYLKGCKFILRNQDSAYE